MALNKKNLTNLFYIFVTTHLIIWTLVPTLTNNNLPLDTIEHLAWGSNLDWGFNKHPPVVAFVLEFFYQIFGAQDWAYYLLSQIFVVISFFVVFKLAEEFFKKKVFSLLSVLLLEGIYFYNFTTPEFNVNVCLLPFWALTILYFWKGVKDNKITDWFLVGLFAGFGLLSKYLFIYLGLGVDIFIIYMIYKKKIDFKCLVSLIPFFIVFLPHLIWLTENNYITITYGLHRTGAEDPDILNHIKHPLMFLGKQIGILIPFFLMLFYLINKFKYKISFKDDKLLFLLVINIVPIALVFLTSMILGVKIRTMWMTPFYLFFGILVIYIFQSQINLNKLKGFTTLFIILFIFSPFAYAYVSITKTDKRTDYPGKEEAEKVKLFYKNQNQVTGEMAFVKGNEWIAGNLSYHLEERPKWIYDPNNIFICNKDLECVKYK
jgi:4-amino-4-deoxy-L-arabinose transferase-like glycosyltransferase